ncbi:MAG: DUF1905 domain-containing protein [Nocardioidaceae bacterium]
MASPPWQFAAELWLASSVDSWVFVTVPRELSEDIREADTAPPKGFGSVRVEVTQGDTTWRTSVFPDAASGCFVLPVKKAVRRAEGLEVGDTATFTLTLEDA